MQGKIGFSLVYVPFCFLRPRHALGCLWWVGRLGKFCLEGCKIDAVQKKAGKVRQQP